MQMSMEQLGDIPPPVPQPINVTGELDLTQGFGPLDNGTFYTRGYNMMPSGTPFFSNASQVGHCLGSAQATLECCLKDPLASSQHAAQ